MCMWDLSLMCAFLVPSVLMKWSWDYLMVVSLLFVTNHYYSRTTNRIAYWSLYFMSWFISFLVYVTSIILHLKVTGIKVLLDLEILIMIGRNMKYIIDTLQKFSFFLLDGGFWREFFCSSVFMNHCVCFFFLVKRH